MSTSTLPWSFPSLPDAADVPRASAPLTLRYDDLTQDGQVKLASLPLAVERACFHELWTKSPLLDTYKTGIFPILTRLCLEGDVGTVLLGAQLEARGAMQLAHEVDGSGQVQALIVNMSAELYGPLGRSVGAPPEGAGKPVCLGRVFGEHVFTKPFAPAGERKVLRLDLPGVPQVPRAAHTRLPLSAALDLPPSAAALDTKARPDAAPWAFGLVHTDHNQHVNSLVYGRLFEEAALRRLGELGEDTKRHARRVELFYRKPCFAGERLTCMLRAFRAGDSVGVVGYLAATPETPIERAHCAARVVF